MPVRTDRVRAWPFGVDERWAVLEGDAPGDAEVSDVDIRPTPPDGGLRVAVVDMSKAEVSVLNGQGIRAGVLKQ